jgi:predicted nucleic acid-binding protein
VRVYADSSFIVRLVTGESDSPQIIAEYRRRKSPKLFYLPLHALEVRNAILQRAFHKRRSSSSEERRHVARERDAALGRLEGYLARGSFYEVAAEMEVVIAKAVQLSAAHTERFGARAIDVLHVAAAITLESELFLTTDGRQEELAKAGGLKVASIN